MATPANLLSTTENPAQLHYKLPVKKKLLNSYD